jgi:ADP-ribose pyrophosphatase
MTGAEPTIESQTIYRGRVVNLRVDTVRLPNGGLTRREIVEHPNSVCVVPLDDQGRVLLVRQYRKPAERTLLEVPAGGVEEGEEPDGCVQRELQEETGYSAEHIQHIASFWTTPGFCTELMHTYLATGLKPGTLKQEADEDIQLVRVPLRDVPGLIRRGEIQDAKSIASLLMVLFIFKEERWKR